MGSTADLLAQKQPLAWVTGAAGLIGNQIVQSAREFGPGFCAVGLTRDVVDLTDFKAVETLFHEQKPSLIIHCAALSRSPDCQANPTLARKINVEATAHLARLASEIQFIFFSTDLVFDGSKGNYIETDAPNPLSIYAETKVAAEQIVSRNPRHTIVRTSLNGGTAPKTHNAFNEEMRKAWQQGKTLNLFRDEFRCPIAAIETARAVWDLAQKNATGIFHLAGAERLSRLQLGQIMAARHPELNPKIQEGSLREYIGAPRAPDCSLNLDKIHKVLTSPLPAFSRWLAEHPEIDF